MPFKVYRLVYGWAGDLEPSIVTTEKFPDANDAKTWADKWFKEDEIGLIQEDEKAVLIRYDGMWFKRDE